MNDRSPDPFDELMRRSLRAEADRIEPADALPEIRARAHAQRPSARRPWLLTAGVAAIGTAAAIGAFTVFDGTHNTADDGDVVAGSPGTTTSASGVPHSVSPTTPGTTAPTPAPTEPSISAETEPTVRGVPGVPEQVVSSAVVPVYWLGEQAGSRQKSARLYRTWTKVSGRPAEQALRIMTASKPDDPDYFSVWTGAAVNTVTRAGDVVNVDFKRLPQTRLDPSTADVAAQQLVYTVQGALQNASATRIQVTEQGRTGIKLFGQVDTSRPLTRAQAADVQAFVWVTSPLDKSVVSLPMKVTGIASAFEAQLDWRIVSVKTRDTVAKGTTKTSEAYKFAPFAFIVSKLPPGPYTLEVYEASAEDGRMTSTDSKEFVVK